MIAIQHATPKDIPDLLVMIRQLCAFHGDPCHLGLATAQSRFIDGHLTALIARMAETSVGYAVLEPHWRPMDIADGLDIAHLFVTETKRGQGVGRALIKAARAQAHATGAVRLTIGTAPDNPGAAAAYRAMGLAEITHTPGPRFHIPLT